MCSADDTYVAELELKADELSERITSLEVDLAMRNVRISNLEHTVATMGIAHAAANEIVELKKQNADLREALKRIADRLPDLIVVLRNADQQITSKLELTIYSYVVECTEIANAALVCGPCESGARK
jgi:uncharacterized coiled-coil protein SlyX